MTKRILVTGAAGQLGNDLLSLGVTRGYDMIGAPRTALDVATPGSAEEYLDRVSPEVIINCAAWTAVDDCESDPERANAVNGDAVADLVAAAGRIAARVIQISTDYVFNGEKVGQWLESDTPDPRTAYGRSKLRGERAAADHTVVRTSWLSGMGGNNIVKTIVRLGDEGATLQFVTDQVGKPTFTSDLAAKLLDLSEAPPRGIFHAVNERAVSWYEFAREVLACAGHDPDRVQPITTAEQRPPRAAPRPANSALANSALIEQGFGPPLRDFAEPLQELVKAIRAAAR